MARAKKTAQNQVEDDINQSQMADVDDNTTTFADMGDDLGETHEEPVSDEPVFEPAPMDMSLTLQVTNHSDRCWVGAIKQWIEEGQSFLTFENEGEKQRLIETLVQLNMFANYDRFEWVG